MDNTYLEQFFKQTSEFVSKYRNACEEAEREMGFNVFRMISDYYQRENFHGDILEAYLNPNGNHGKKRFFLNHFIEMLKKENNNNIGNYDDDNTELVREEGIEGRRRIDFVIKNENENGEKRCIIIENKLYDANDQDNQLPAYYKAMHKKGYTVEAMVYLPLSDHKTPDKSTWKTDVEIISPIINIPAKKLIENWLEPCIDGSPEDETIVILKHYTNLLKSLLPNEQKYSAMSELYKFLKENGKDNLQNAIYLRDMLIGLGEAMGRQHIKHLLYEDEELKEYFNNGAIERIGWAHAGIKIKKTGDEIHVSCSPEEWKGAIKVLLVINGQPVNNDIEFNKLLQARTDLKELGFDSQPGFQHGDHKYRKLVRSFDFDKDDDAVRFFKGVVLQLVKS